RLRRRHAGQRRRREPSPYQVASDVRPLDRAQPRVRDLLARCLLHQRCAVGRRPPRREPAPDDGLRPVDPHREALSRLPRRLRLGDPTSARRCEDDAPLRRLLAGAASGEPTSRRQARFAIAHLAIRPRPACATHRRSRRCGGVWARGKAAALMCGLCGVVELDRPADRSTVERWLDELAHRGPDGRGVFASDGVCLGHLRLAILDLSDAGLQPMQDGNLQLLHNGEIYNYIELREELRAKGHTFSTGTDSEVILAAYREWGERCVERFNGMWAFAIWDESRRTLFCSRDRFGVKPFYYRVEGKRFSFASEPWPLGGSGANLRAVRDYLEQGYLDEGDETFFADVVRLPPAHSLTFGPDGLRTWRYWSLEPRPAPSDAVAAVRETFLDAVRLQLRSDVPVGTCLSGGIDSSSIAVAVAAHGHDHQKTVTAYFGEHGFDERPFAQAVVDRTGAEPHWVTFSAQQLVDDLPAIVQAQGEPFGSTSICAGWYVMREAKRAGLTV